MIGASVRRGLAAGLLAGLLAGLFGLVAGEPSLDAAIALEEAADGHAGEGETFSRGVQKAGLVAGTALTGLAVGALFGVAGAWAVGRVQGDAWTRALKLGAAAVGALVVLPALAFPPNPPGAGESEAMALRSGLYLAVGALGLLTTAAAWAGARELAQSELPAPLRQVLVGAGVALVAAAIVVGAPVLGVAEGVPGELLWRFRLAAVGTQVVLWGGTAVLFGLLGTRAQRGRDAANTPKPAAR